VEAPFTATELEACLFKGGRFDDKEGEGDEVEELTPLAEVWRAGGGRFNFVEP
jgi:hypothetical protein